MYLGGLGGDKEIDISNVHSAMDVFNMVLAHCRALVNRTVSGWKSGKGGLLASTECLISRSF